MTLWFGIPFTLLLVAVYYFYRRHQPVPAAMETPSVE